jgi:hypothetical protein
MQFRVCVFHSAAVVLSDKPGLVCSFPGQRCVGGTDSIQKCNSLNYFEKTPFTLTGFPTSTRIGRTSLTLQQTQADAGNFQPSQVQARIVLTLPVSSRRRDPPGFRLLGARAPLQ